MSATLITYIQFVDLHLAVGSFMTETRKIIGDFLNHATAASKTSELILKMYLAQDLLIQINVRLQTV